MKKILIIMGHPSLNSFCNSLAEKYKEGAEKSGKKVEILYLGNFNLEFDLIKAQELIKWVEHITFVYPTWWATPPALLKSFIEKVFVPGFAYQHSKNEKSFKIDKLLKGKSARLISTMDAPPLIYKWILGDIGGKMMEKGILNFCGIKPVYKNYFGSVKMSSEEDRKKWLEKIYKIGLGE
ncbi:MAG: NAD(P)H-dependent oxidoreductase [bacterium]|nr:NAD(P)H-dependent oxidoreductase [bacterium]